VKLPIQKAGLPNKEVFYAYKAWLKGLRSLSSRIRLSEGKADQTDGHGRRPEEAVSGRPLGE
jgi:hypothetical protein